MSVTIEESSGLLPASYEALGRFVVMCSTIEVSMHATLKMLLAFDDTLVRMLVKEPRTQDLLDYLKQTAEFKKLAPEQMQALDLLSQDIQFLNAVRSFVAHKMVFQYSDRLVFTNLLTAAKASSIYDYTCTTEELVNGALYGSRVAESVLKLRLAGDRDPAAYLDDVQKLRAWRDKLQLPANPSQRNQQTAKSKHQPPASQE
jgi:hypothetical protein